MFTILDDIEYIGDNFCDTSEVLSVLRMVGYVLFILKLLIPIIIIYVETIKFVGAVKEGSQESVTKHAKGLLLRLAIGIIIIFIPTIIHAVLNSFISADSKNCEICVLKPFSCTPKDPSTMNSIDSEEEKIIEDTDNKEDKIEDPRCNYRSSSQRYCENVDECKWEKSNEEGKQCVYRDPNLEKDICTSKCNNTYTVGSKENQDCINKCLGQETVQECVDMDLTTCSNNSDKCKVVTEKMKPLPRCVDKDYVTEEEKEEEKVKEKICANRSQDTCEAIEGLIGMDICYWNGSKCVPKEEEKKDEDDESVLINPLFPTN